MAALYLHNALHSPESSTLSETTPSPHNRNISTVSNATLYTSTSEYSHPTEPLLRAGTLEAVAYRDLLSQQPMYSDANRTAGLSLDNGLPLQEKTSLWHQRVERRHGLLKLIEGSLGIIMGVWAIYNTVRYFLAFTLYDAEDGQATSLGLGISTAVSFALLVCALILSKFQPYLLLHQVPLRTLLFTRKSFHALSSFFLLAPAVYNLVMTFIWRNSTNPELNFQRRCHPDLDVIWSVSNPRCNSRVWGTWLALSVIRLILTLGIIIVYHVVSCRIRGPTYSARHQYHYQRRSQQSDSQSSIPPSFAAYLPSDDSPSLSSRPARHQSSDSTLSSHTHSKNSSLQQSPRTLHPHSSMSSLYSGEDAALEAEINEQAAHARHHQEPNSFADRFRALISQITRETDLGVELARHDSMLYEENSSLSLPPVPLAVGYDEFGRPYPPEEHVSFLNGYIRRMPTIESMGSREMGSMTISSGLTTSRRSTATFSRPPTRANTFSSAASHPMSRDSSLIACEMPTALGRTNEMGELVDRSEDGNDPSRRQSGAAMSGNTTSTSTSYYSATGSAPPNATEDVLLHPPGLDELAC